MSNPNNWTVYDFPFEIGAIGFLGMSANTFLSALGFHRAQLKSIFTRMAKISLRSSFYIWNSRNCKSWISKNLPVLCKNNMLPSKSLPTPTLRVPFSAPSMPTPSDPRELALSFLSHIKKTKLEDIVEQQDSPDSFDMSFDQSHMIDDISARSVWNFGI